jgi:hypothetical protein
MVEVMLWRRFDLPGHEIATLEDLGEGWKISGTAIFASEQGPCKLDYAVSCDPGWQTKAAQISGIVGGNRVSLIVSADAERRWHLNGVECGAVQGCIDIDLGFSPSTNLLPIRRLALDTGQEAAVKAAWLPFPSFRFEPLPQLYRREGDRAWHYESRGGAFVRKLEVNSAGFVTSYPGLWESEFAR